MRACFQTLVGQDFWDDDPFPEPSNLIFIDTVGGRRAFAYVGVFKTPHHSFRRYQEVASHGTQ